MFLSSSLSYWLKKHGLEAARAEKHAAKRGIAKEDLERLLEAGLSLREIAQRMDRSFTTIRHWMNSSPTLAASEAQRMAPGRWRPGASVMETLPSYAREVAITGASDVGWKGSRSEGDR
ncbi:MAG: helix-turn-helix domain-containing protein [Solirubrobacterales bacterium]